MSMTIRKMVPDDLQPLHQLLSDPRAMQYLEPPYSLEQTRRFLQEAGLSPAPLIRAVESDTDGFMGYVIYHDYDEKSVEIGWVLARHLWGRGYASQLTGQLIAMAAAEKRDVVIECVPEQKATQAIAKKYGFSYAGESDGLLVYRLENNR